MAETDKNKSLVDSFESRERDITDYVIDRISHYDASECKKKLRNRMAKLDDSVDMKFSPGNTRVRSANNFKSKICMPLVREKYRLFNGMTLAAFRHEPKVTVLPEGDTPRINAVVAQEVLNQNFRRTEFDYKAWRGAVQYLGRYGVAVMPFQYRASDKVGKEKTVYGPFGFEKKAGGNERRHNVFNYCVNPLNYFQNPAIADPCDSDYRGYRDRIPLATLIAEYENDEFMVKKNLKEVIGQAMKATVRDAQYFTKGQATDWYRVGVDLTYWYGTINIAGNENDQNEYYVQVIGDKIVRFGTNPYDEGITPISVYTCDPRLEYWWGNTPIENSVPMENFLNMILQMRADQAAQVIERFLFYDKGAGIDPADLNNRKINGGYVGVGLKAGMRAQDVFFEYQPRDYSASSIEPIIREVKEADQRLSFESDFQRPAMQGGPQNQTATAAIMMDEKGNVLKSDLLEMVGFGLINTARGNLTMLQQMLPDYFMLAPDRAPPLKVFKQHVLGTYKYQLHSCLLKNKATQQTNLINFLTQMVNFRGTGDPVFQQMNLLPILKELVRKYDLDTDTNDIFMPAAQPQIQQQSGVTTSPMNGAPGDMQPPAPPQPEAQPAQELAYAA
jgi:hypothetical protein